MRKGLVVSKHDVRLLVKELDSEVVMLRKRRRYADVNTVILVLVSHGTSMNMIS